MYKNCNQTSVQECLTECPEVTCYVRDLRNAVKESDCFWRKSAQTNLEDLIELALEDHWHKAYDTGVKETLFDQCEQIQDSQVSVTIKNVLE